MGGKTNERVTAMIATTDATSIQHDNRTMQPASYTAMVIHQPLTLPHGATSRNFSSVGRQLNVEDPAIPTHIETYVDTLYCTLNIELQEVDTLDLSTSKPLLSKDLKSMPKSHSITSMASNIAPTVMN